MRILFVNTYYYPNMVGGTENSVKLLAERLVANKNNVCFFTADGYLCDKQIDFINGVELYRRKQGGTFEDDTHKISSFRRLSNKLLEVNNPFLKKEFENLIKKFKPDVINTNNLHGLSTYVWVIAHKYNIPIVHTIRDYRLMSMLHRVPFASSLVSILIRNRSEFVNCVTAPSVFTLNSFLEKGYFSHAISLCIPNAIDLNLPETKRIIQEKSKIDSKKIRFLYVGMLNADKGIDRLINALKNVNNANITLDICGTGPLREFVLEACDTDGRINYLGQIAKEELKKVYINHDVLIVPSVWEEPFGRVVIEGNQYGLPVIGSNRGGIKEIIDNIKTGELFNPEDSSELTTLIKKFSNRSVIKSYFPSIIEGIGRYSLDRQVEVFEDIYRRSVTDNKE